jgi:hypothetical protein
MRAMDEVEAGLANALVLVVVGTHPRVSQEYVLHFLEKVLGVYAKEVVIHAAEENASCSTSASGKLQT